MKMPVLVFTASGNDLGVFTGKFISGDFSLLENENKWNCDVEIIDSSGLLFFVSRLLPSKRVLWFDSLVHLRKHVYAHAVLKSSPSQITLDELKERIKKCIKRNKSFWSSINDGRGLNKMVDSCKDYKELILLFK